MTLATWLKNSFLAGLLLVAPLVVTLLVLSVLAGWALRVVDPVVTWTGLARYTANDALVARALAAVVMLATVTLLGWLAQRSVGRRVFGNVGRVVNLIPLVNTLYVGVRQVATSLVDRDSSYESVVLVEYPREGLYSIGLVTGDGPRAMRETTGEAVTVFLPNSPNPTGGRLIVAPTDQVHEVDMSVRRGMRLVVTTGIGAGETVPTLPPLEDGADPRSP